jgi:UDP-N-acetylmuramate-alanine ligase
MRDRTCIAVAGTHGKTTTTAMIAQVLNCGYFVGGEIVEQDAVAKDAKMMVVEADESDGTLVGYTPDYSIITNIEYDHMEHHASESAFLSCFELLIKNTQKKVFYCADDPIASKLCSPFPHCEAFSLPPHPLKIPLPGQHNQWNAAATQAVCKIWMSEEKIRYALQRIQPVRRRFETLCQQNGIRVISDYAHHPTEIAALIQTAQSLQPRRILLLFQPHRYTRTRALGADFPAAFKDTDLLWLVPVYPASEPLLEGGTTKDLLAHFSAYWEGRIHFSASLEAAWKEIKNHLSPGDLLLIAGAGDVEKVGDWAKAYFQEPINP